MSDASRRYIVHVQYGPYSTDVEVLAEDAEEACAKARALLKRRGHIGFLPMATQSFRAVEV